MSTSAFYLVVGQDNIVHYGCACEGEWVSGPAFAYDLCQQYINDAVDTDVDGAAYWRVVPVMRKQHDPKGENA